MGMVKFCNWECDLCGKKEMKEDRASYGYTIDSDSWQSAVIKVIIGDRIHVFCSSSCRMRFQKLADKASASATEQFEQILASAINPGSVY